MLEVFIALILITFLALFIMLSFPMKADDVDYRDKSKAQDS
jgi:hypothetical protein